MFKHTNLVLMIALLGSVMVAGLAIAEEEESPAQEIAKMDGKDLYKTFCKVCHAEGAEAGEYTPMSLIMEQWEDFFDAGFTESHKDLVCPEDETKKVTDVLDKDLIKKIKKFCVDHAADSEQPMTCG
ncbi:MAG: cytochrome c [Candidatus Krumholzibacteriia bacterium]